MLHVLPNPAEKLTALKSAIELIKEKIRSDNPARASRFWCFSFLCPAPKETTYASTDESFRRHLYEINRVAGVRSPQVDSDGRQAVSDTYDILDVYSNRSLKDLLKQFEDDLHFHQGNNEISISLAP